MKMDSIFTLSRTFAASLTLLLSTPLFAQDAPGTPPLAAPAIAAAPEDSALAPPRDDLGGEIAALHPRKKEVHIERRGGGKIRIEERDESDETDESEENAPFKRKFDAFGGAGGKRVFRFSPGPGGDVVLKGFRGPDGPMLAARAEAEAEGAVEHVQEAIRHLHAAGLHDLAERAQVRAEQMRVRTTVDAELRRQFEQLKREHENLKKEMKKLQKLAQHNEAENPGTKGE